MEFIAALGAELWRGTCCIGGVLLPVYMFVHARTQSADAELLHEWLLRRLTHPNRWPTERVLVRHQALSACLRVAAWLLLVNALRAVFVAAAVLDSPTLRYVVGAACVALAVLAAAARWDVQLFAHGDATRCLVKRGCQVHNFYAFNRCDGEGPEVWLECIEDGGYRDGWTPPQGDPGGSLAENRVAAAAWKLPLDTVRAITRAAGGIFPHSVFVTQLLAATTAQDSAEAVRTRRNTLANRLATHAD